jgi:Trp operon repressor
MRPNLSDFLKTSNAQSNNQVVDENSGDGILNKLTSNYKHPLEGSSRPTYQSVSELGSNPNIAANAPQLTTIDISQDELTSAVNSFRRGIDQTQISNYQGKLDSHQEIIDNNVRKQKKLIDLYNTKQIDKLELEIELQKINKENNEASKQISKYNSDINDNKLEMEDEYVSKIYQMKEALVQAKGGDAGLWESIAYTMPSTLGSSASLAGQTLAATFGTGLIKKAATSLATGLVGGPVGEGLAIAATVGTTIGLLANGRYQETMAEIGGQLEGNKEALLAQWMQANPGLEPDEDVMREIRIQARKGKDRMFEEQMMLVVPDAIESLLMPGSKVLGAFKTGRKIERTLGAVGQYSKSSRVASVAAKYYGGYLSEKFEEGFQYITGKNQENKALGLEKYNEKSFMSDLLSDSYNTLSSISYGPGGSLSGGGIYSEDKEFQFAEQSGGLMSVLMGAIPTATNIYKDINKYRETTKELKNSGIANPDDKWFKLKDQIYKKHFDNNNINFLLEGVRNLGKSKNEKGIPYLTEKEVLTETKNIKDAFDKYLDVSRYIEDITPDGKFNLFKSKEQLNKLEVLKSELFNSSMNMTRYKDKFSVIENLSNINNLINHTENIVSRIENQIASSDKTVKDVYHLDSRLENAKLKLKQLNNSKEQLLKNENLNEKDLISNVSIENSNKNKEYILNDLNLTEQERKYNELLKVKDNKTLNEWFDKLSLKEKELKSEINKKEEKNKKEKIKDIVSKMSEDENWEPEDQDEADFFAENIDEIDQKVYKKTNEELTADIFGNPEEETQIETEDVEIPSADEVDDSEPIINQDKGVKAKTVAKTNQGFDGIIYRDINKDDHSLIGESQNTYILRNFRTKNTIEIAKSDLSQFERINKVQNQRVFRWINKNEVKGYRLRIVTKNNNIDLYKEILQDNPDALNAEEKHFKKTGKPYPGIWTVITNDKNEIVRVDGKLLAMTLETVDRVLNDDLIVDKKKGTEDIAAIREAAINTTDPNAYFEVNSKSNGIAQFENKENGKRVRKSVIGRIINKFSDTFKLTLATQKGTYLNGIPLDLGKLYIEDKDGRVLDLLPRLINESEINLIINLLEQEITGNKEIDKPIDEIKKIVSFKKTANPQYQLYISNGELFFGEDSLNKNNFEEKIEDLISFLESKRVNANNLYINKNIQVPTTNGKGKTISYAEYLLQGENPMFGTDLKDKSNIQFLNQYLRYNPTIKYAEEVIEDSDLPTEDDINSGVIIDSLGVSEIDSKKDEIEKTATEINRLVGLKSNDRVVRQAIIDTNNKKMTLEELDVIKKNWDNTNGLTNAFAKITRLRKELEALENKGNIAIDSLLVDKPTNIIAPKLMTVQVDLLSLSIDELKNVATQIRQKAVDARQAEKEGKTIIGGSQAIESDYQAVKKYIADLVSLNNTGQDAEIVNQGKNPTPAKKPIVKKDNFEERDELNRLRSRTADKTLVDKKEIEWFKYNFPTIPIDKVIGLIEQKSMGRFLSSARVLLSDQAVTGTLYHEAFHAVTQLYLTKEEVDRLYKEVAERTGITDRFEAEELLAEDFINYKKNGAVLKGAPQRNTLFRKILNAIKDFLGLKASDINEVYRRLDSGYYRNSKVVGLKEFSSLSKDSNKAFVIKEKGTKFLIDTLDGMDLMFFNSILHPDSANKNISNIIYNKFRNLYNEEEESQDLVDSYSFILKNFDGINELWKERLVALGFKFSEERFDEVTDENKGEETLDEKEEQGKEDLKGTKDQNFVNQKDLLTSSSKMLIKSLKRLNYKNDLGLEVPLDFGQTYNYLIKNIAGTGNNYLDIMDKLKSLVKDKPEIQQLIDMLGETGDSISNKQFNLQTAFTKDFNKTRTDSLITVISPNGAIRIIDARKMNDADMVKEIWNSNLVSLFPQNEAGNQVIPNVKEFIKVRDNIEFLSKIGIQFNEYALEYLNENQSELTDSVTAIKNYLVAQDGNVNSLFSSKSDLYKRIDNLINTESKYAPYVNELSFISTEGKTVYSVGENNGLSRTINEINKSKNLTELRQRLPHLDTVTVKNSQYIKKLFDEDGVKIPGAELKLYLQDGIKSSSDAENQVKQSTRKSTIGDLMTQQFNSLLQKGISSFIVSADKSSEFGIGLSLKEGNLVIPIDFVEDNFNSPKIKEIFRGYFEDELNRIALFILDEVGNNIDYYRKEAKNFTIFQDIIPSETRKNIIKKFDELKNEGKSYKDAKANIEELLNNNFEAVNTKTVEFFNNYEKELTKMSKKFKLINGDNFSGITDDVKSKHSNEALIRAIAVNSYINNVEQTKLFTGDLAFYKAIYKRSAAFAGTKEIPRVDSAINSYLTKNFPRKDGKVQDGMEGVIVFDNVETQKLELDEYLAAYKKKGIESEAALKILGFTKADIEKINRKESIEKSKGKAYAKMDEGDAMGWCTIDFYREFMNRLSNWSDAQEFAYQKMQMQKFDYEGNLTEGELLTGKEIQLFQQLKLQYAGPQEMTGSLFAPAYHKFTVLPLLPELVKGKNISKTLKNMTDSQVGYSLFGSGSKVGSVTNANGELTPFYTGKNNGQINSEGYNIQRVYYNFLGLQQKPSKPHDTAVFSTQFRKTPWIGSFENGKELIEGAMQRFEDFSNLINQKTQDAKDELLIELGIRPGDTTYTSTNVENLVNLLQDEARQRNLPNNLIESIDFKIEEGKQILKTKFDAVVNKDKITSMLMSLIDARIIRQQFNGDAYVLSSVAGFEPIGERSKGPNKALRGYTIDPVTGKTLPAEVMIPMSKNYYPLFKMFGNNLDKLNEAIRNKDPRIDPRVLELIGCRIPGQEHNSNEYLTIKEFLPEASATTMIAHPEIVAKAGSDFDNDKLFTYRAKMNPDGSYDTKSIDNGIVKVLKDQISHESNFTKLITPNSTSIVDEFVEHLKYINYKNRLTIKNRTAKEPAKIMDEDKYLETLNQEGVKYSDLLKITKQIEARYKLWLAKDEVGPVAIANAYGPIAQAGNLTANQFFFRETIQKGVKITERVPVNIRLKHNKTEDGKINLAAYLDAEKVNPITQVNGQQINIVVDAANEVEPSVAYLNMVMETLPVYLYLNRAGVEFQTVASFMTQNIMTEYLTLKGISNSALSKVLGLDADSNAITQAKKKYVDYLLNNIAELKGKEENIPAFLAEYQKDELSKSDLMDYLEVENQEGIEYAITQLQVLDDYTEYREHARMLNEAVRTTNHDSAGIGQNLISVEEKKLLEIKVAKAGFINGLERVKDTFLGAFNQDELALRAYSPFFYTKSDSIIKNNTIYLLQEVKNNNFIFSKDDSVKTGNLIENDFINFIVQNYGYENPSQRMDELFRGENSIAKRVLELKNRVKSLNKPKDELTSRELEEKEIVDNILISQLYPMLRTEKKSVDNIKLFNKKIDTYTSDQLTEAFEQLMSLDPELTKDIIDLGILQSGLNNSPITFLGIIPNSYYSEVVNKGFDKFSEMNNKDEIIKQFNQLFLRNNAKDRFISKVAYVKGLNKEELGDGMFGKNFLMKNYIPSMAETKTDTINNEKQIKRLFVPNVNMITDFEPEVQKLFNEPTVELYETAIGNYEYDLSADISDEVRKDIESKLQDVKNSFEITSTNQNITQDPKTPEFNKLPGKSSTPTMTYAGIGSRETPQEVLELMTKAAKYLESLGYTLRSGRAPGADAAFEKGVTSKKEIFLGSVKTGERELKIAEEIHPAWNVMLDSTRKKAIAKGNDPERSASFVANLMARNTNQIFGKNLDTPVDFVLFYAKETADPLRPAGGTGQAVEMARRKGIPTINMADANWREQLKNAVANKPPKSAQPSTTTPSQTVQIKSSIVKNNWTKDSPKENPNTAYVFTENINSIGSSRIGGGSAIIRNNPNAIGIVTKKYYVYAEDRATSKVTGGWNQDFQNTEADFELFKKINLEQFAKIDKYDSKIFPKGFASDLAKIPTRFAEWLQSELLNRYGLVTELNDNKTGLISKSITSAEQSTSVDQEVKKPLVKNEFNYKGKSIDTEFKLGNDQEKALKQLADFLTDSKETVITLQGAAGTGKTSVIGYLQKYIGKKFAYMAPTHAATAELAFATVKTGNTDLPSTIQSSLAYNTKEKTWKFSIKVQKRLGFRPTVVVDESSMIDDVDIAKLKEAINDVGGKLILMGDEKQISKVTQGNNETKQVSSAFTDYKQVNLTEIFRQKDADLLDLLSKMRSQTDFKLFKTENSENVKFLGKKEYMDELVSDLMLNPEGTVVVSYTNKSVSSINMTAREILGRTGETKVGDIVVGYLGYASKQIEKADIANSVQYKIDSIVENGSVRQINVSSKKIKNLKDLGIKNIDENAFTNYYQLSSDDSLTFDNLSNKDFAKNNEEVSKVFRAIHKASLDYKNGRINYASYLSILAGINETLRKYSVGNDYIYNPETDSMERYDEKKHKSLPQNGQGSLKFDKDIDYGHAITIHKSQGSTIDNVYFDASSLSSARNTPIVDRNGVQITTEKQSLAYVAMSRSKNKLVVYEGAEEFEMINPKKTNNISESKENNVPLTSEDDIILDTLGESTYESSLRKLRDAFSMYNGFFNSNGITNIDQLNKLSESKLDELLVKFCKI